MPRRRGFEFRGDGGGVSAHGDGQPGNTVTAHARGVDARLTPAGSHAAGSRGVPDGPVVDHPASQGSLGWPKTAVRRTRSAYPCVSGR
jgi:hypothetical protein